MSSDSSDSGSGNAIRGSAGGSSDLASDFIVGPDEDGVAGSIKFAQFVVTFIGGIVLAVFSVPIQIFETLRQEIVDAIAALTGWIVEVVELIFRDPISAIGLSTRSVESFIQSAGPLALPFAVLIGLILAWMFWTVIS